MGDQKRGPTGSFICSSEKLEHGVAAMPLPVLGKFKLADAKTRLPGQKRPAALLRRMNEFGSWKA
jgi:hypothetical protein